MLSSCSGWIFCTSLDAQTIRLNYMMALHRIDCTSFPLMHDPLGSLRRKESGGGQAVYEFFHGRYFQERFAIRGWRVWIHAGGKRTLYI